MDFLKLRVPTIMRIEDATKRRSVAAVCDRRQWIQKYRNNCGLEKHLERV